MRGYYEQLYDFKRGNQEEKDQFFVCVSYSPDV